MKQLESLVLRIVEPQENSSSGRFASAENLHARLNRRMPERDADRRALPVRSN